VSLHLKYRPKNWSEVLGNEATVASLQGQISNPDRAHFYLFIGERGTGKTTFARLLAQELGIEQIEETNAANANGVDFARELEKRIVFRGFGGDKMYILDECHRLTPEAQEILLKTVLEETPAHAYIVFATTDPQKLKATVRSRAAEYRVETPDKRELIKYLKDIADKEQIQIDRQMLGKIVTAKDRNPRESLVLLNQMRGIDPAHQDELIVNHTEEEKAEVIQLAKLLVRPAPWVDIAPVLAGITAPPEVVVQTVRTYTAKTLLKNKHNAAFNVLLSFQGYKPGDGLPGLVKASYEAYMRNQ